MNQSLQMKLLWKLIAEPDNLWVKIVNEKYLKSSNLWNYKKQCNTSWQWSKLMSLREGFMTGISWQVGDGKTIRFWKDTWVTEGVLKPTPNNLSMWDEDETVSNYIKDDKSWDIDKLRHVLKPEEVDEVCKVVLPLNNIIDRLYWRPSKNGWFSTNATMKWIQDKKRSPKIDLDWIWKLNIPPKQKNFLWKMCRNGLPTKFTLA